ncbi:hypothetical protein [Paraburkholderia sp. BR14320]|uniref:hypothetical protein n=1 Tax=unclassified Paraburkholderia TaxID=2615204 RepID=UPI0034CD876E
MTTISPIRPNLLKGALAVYPTHTPGSRPSAVIAFQFNPEAMKRTLVHRAAPPPQTGNTGAAKEDVLRVAGPPVETISMTVDMHASDQLEDPSTYPAVALNGLHPALATLELLMYPPTLSASVITQQAAAGQVQVSPADLPLVLLVWGKQRVVPVKLTSFSVSEDAFDTHLNPIAAKVELAMQVLTYMEFTDSSIGRDAFIAYQKAKESLAQINRTSGTLGDAAMLALLPR